MNELTRIKNLFRKLSKQPQAEFPKPRAKLDAPTKHGVYVLRDPQDRVVHVGRTHRAAGGLRQRLRNHLAGQSSFVYVYLKDKPSRLRTGFTFQYLEVQGHRERALLEHFATAMHCPRHLGVGAKLLT